MKNGFTLIELLAVIVILAIIAVIAVPIVIDIIEDTKINSVKTSASMYLKSAELYISNAELNKVKINPGAYSITKEGDICIGIIEDSICTGEVIKIDIKGNKPSSGQIIVDEGSLKIDYLEINGYIYYKDNEEYIVEKVTKDSKESNNGVITLDSSKVPYLTNYRIYGNSYQATRSGKNLIPYPYHSDTQIKNGITYTINENGSIHVSGTATNNSTFILYQSINELPESITSGNKYTLSYTYSEEDRPTIGHLNIVCNYYKTGATTSGNYNSWLIASVNNNGNEQAPEDLQGLYCYLIVMKDKTVEGTVYPQLELGETSTEYEPYGVMPSPEFPSEIKSVGDLVTDEQNIKLGQYKIDIKNIGNNLFVKNEYLKIEDYTQHGTYYSKKINLKSSTNYNVSVIRKNGYDGKNHGFLLISNVVWINGNSWTAIAHESLPDKSNVDFQYTTDSNGVLYIGYHGVTQNDLDYIWANTDVKIEEGTIATDYVEKVESIYLEEPLRCVSDVCDYIDYESGKVVRYIVEKDNNPTKTIEENFEVLSNPIIENIELPKININDGVNNIFIDTNIKPSKVSVNYYK